jgi:hypothetical protein
MQSIADTLISALCARKFPTITITHPARLPYLQTVRVMQIAACAALHLHCCC